MKPDLIEVIVRPRCRLRHGGAVYVAGSFLKVTDEEWFALSARRVVVTATEETATAVADAIAKGLPIPGYVATENGADDVTDPRAVSRRARAAKIATSR
jgi:hypothetical protein